MSELVPAAGQSAAAPQALAPLASAPGEYMLGKLRGLAGQGPVRRALPLFIGLAALGGAALAWTAISPSPQRLLYAQLDDADRAGIVAALDQAAISYDIDNATGALSVDETDFYRARMLVAADDALATPESGAELLDSLPMGASRMLEGERLREARERDLMLTIREIDGVKAVRVHLAEGEQSVFVRDTIPPSASVMVRLARGRQLSPSQVGAIVNLVAASVPGLAVENVRVVDQQGKLLSDKDTASTDRLDLQSRMEQKLRTQVSQLLTPMMGEDNFSSEIQVELDMDEVTSARESYDKEGVVRSETEAQSQTAGPTEAAGVPGVMSNTPPAPADAEARPPEGTENTAPQPAPVNEESSASRTYELGREVSVANTAPGTIKRLSVAVALSKSAMKGSKPADLEQLKQLVSAAVGADPDRGDQVTVMVRSFEPVTEVPPEFYETAWFATLVRYGAALLAVLLVLLLAVRPAIKALRRDPPLIPDDGFEEKAENPLLAPGPDSAESEADDGEPAGTAPPTAALIAAMAESGGDQARELMEKVNVAQRIVAERPDSAVAALRQMLNDSEDGENAGEEEAAL